mgnify:CR=1 FL=1
MKHKIFILLIIIVIIALLVIGFLYWQNNPSLFSEQNLLNNIGNIVNEIAPDTNTQTNNTENTTGSVNNTDVNSIQVAINDSELPEYNFYFELPLNGSTGYASIAMNMVKSPTSSTVVKKLSAGDGFRILEEDGNWWKVKTGETTGYVKHKYCMINLPDIIPSIVYDDTNSYQSLFTSSYTAIPNVTGEKLYDVLAYNERLEKDEYRMPIIYAMAKKIMKAQQAALKDDYSLKIYETFRPYETQKRVASNLKELMENNKDVYNGIYGGGWSEDWFIAQSISNHQRGVAMDVSLVKVEDTQIKTTGEYKYLEVTQYMEEEMPTKMHELSDKAVTFKYGVQTSSKTAWKSVPLATSMTEGAKRLQKYCTEADLTPLSSEWWHFNDLDAKQEIGSNYSTGRYYIEDSFSIVPE